MADDRDPGASREAEEVLELDGDAPASLADAMQEALAAVEERQAPARNAEPGTAAADLEAQLAELREKWLRALADLENYRKRTQRDRAEEARYRGFDVLRGLVVIVDNLDRALASEGSVSDLKQGVELIRRQLEALLRDHGVERVEALGKPFDPAVHEAVSQHADPGVAEPTVTEELRPAYRLHERLLRPAAVRVGMPAAEEPQHEGET
jgi:molecular chaperone GrpE